MTVLDDLHKIASDAATVEDAFKAVVANIAMAAKDAYASGLDAGHSLMDSVVADVGKFWEEAKTTSAGT